MPVRHLGSEDGYLLQARRRKFPLTDYEEVSRWKTVSVFQT